MTEINQKLVNRINKLLEKGLVSGLGKQQPGKMCVEAVICYALDLPHGDNPPCVGTAVRAAKIQLNDSAWSTPIARAEGMKNLAIAQLGSDKINQKIFARKLVIKTINIILADLLDQINFPKLANDCRNAKTLKIAAKAAAKAAADAAAWAAAKAAADAAAWAATDAAEAAAWAATGAATGAAKAAARAAAKAAARTARTAAAAAAARDKILRQFSDIMTNILIEMSTAGSKYLNLE